MRGCLRSIPRLAAVLVLTTCARSETPPAVRVGEAPPPSPRVEPVVSESVSRELVDGSLDRERCIRRPDEDPRCASTDYDNDGIPLAEDKCPMDAEDCDGDSDADGCPDLSTIWFGGLDVCEPQLNPACRRAAEYCVPWTDQRPNGYPDAVLAPGLCVPYEAGPCDCLDGPPFGCEDGPPSRPPIVVRTYASTCRRRSGPYCLAIVPKVLEKNRLSTRPLRQKLGFEVLSVGNFELVVRVTLGQIETLYQAPPHFSRVDGRCMPRVDQMVLAPDWRTWIAAARPVNCDYKARIYDRSPQ